MARISSTLKAELTEADCIATNLVRVRVRVRVKVRVRVRVRARVFN